MKLLISKIALAATSVALLGAMTMTEPYGSNTNEQRSTIEAEKELSETLAKLNSTCGTSITATINWKGYESFSAADRSGRTMQNIYEIASSQTMPSLRNLTDGCRDKLFKDNLTKKVKKIVFTPTKGEVSLAKPSHTFKIAQGTLTITYNFQTSNSSSEEVNNNI